MTWWQLHLLLCVAVMVALINREPLWKVATAYCSAYIAAGLVLHGVMRSGESMGYGWYLACIVFECGIIFVMSRIDHPASQAIKVFAGMSIISHALAALAFVPIPIFWDVFIEFKHANTVCIRVFEASQLLSLVIYSAKAFRHFDTMSKKEKTWQAKLATR